MIGIGLFIVVILAITLAAWLSVAIWWRRKSVRYVSFLMAVLGTWFLVRFFTYDPNLSPAAKAWYGQYSISGCSSGSVMSDNWAGPVLSLYAQQVCAVQDSINDTSLIVGCWDFVETEDMSFLELDFPKRGIIQIYGDTSGFSSNAPLPVGICK